MQPQLQAHNSLVRGFDMYVHAYSSILYGVTSIFVTSIIEQHIHVEVSAFCLLLLSSPLLSELRVGAKEVA